MCTTQAKRSHQEKLAQPAEKTNTSDELVTGRNAKQRLIFGGFRARVVDFNRCFFDWYPIHALTGPIRGLLTAGIRQRTIVC